MSTRSGRRPGRVARRAVFGAVAAWFAAVGGVAGVSWLAIQSAGYAVTGSRLIGTSLDAPPEVAGHPTRIPPTHAASGSAGPTRTAGATKSGRPSSSASPTPGGPVSASGGQSSRNGSHAGSSTGGTSAGGQNQPGIGQNGGSTQAPTSTGSHTGGQQPTTPATTVTTPPTSTSSASGATSRSTSGGLVVAECVGERVYWSVEPTNGWTTLRSERIDDGVKTGFRRSERVIEVTITCDHGTPTIDVRSSDSSSD